MLKKVLLPTQNPTTVTFPQQGKEQQDVPLLSYSRCSEERVTKNC